MSQRATPSEPNARKTVLSNGVRVITECLDHVDSVSLGVWLDWGARDDPAARPGASHFVEHMLFKGTESRSTRQIAEAVDDIGGHVNGYTDREAMHLYARSTAEQTEAALDLLFDLLLHPGWSEDDLDRERQVVLQEIAQIEDIAEDWVHELVPQAVWEGHPLGRPLLGTRESIRALSGRTLLDQLATMRAADRLVVAAAGRVDHDRVVEHTERVTKSLRAGEPRAVEQPPEFQSYERFVERQNGQTHFCAAWPGVSRCDENRYALSVLDTLLGGGSSSRLFQEIRENRGLAYGLGSYFQAYRDAGLFVVTAGVAPEDFPVVLHLIDGELDRLRREGVVEEELERAKTQLRVSLALALENTAFRMQHLALSDIHFGRILSFGEIAEGIEAVTAEEAHLLAETTFARGRRALVAIGPQRTGEGGHV